MRLERSTATDSRFVFFRLNRVPEIAVHLPAVRTRVHDAVQLEEAHEMGVRRQTSVSLLLLQLQFYPEDEPTATPDGDPQDRRRQRDGA